jgi:hypothetical protein
VIYSDQWADLPDGYYRIRVDLKWTDAVLCDGFWFIEGRESSLEPESITHIAPGRSDGNPRRHVTRRQPTWRQWWKARSEIFAWMLVCVLFVAIAVTFLVRLSIEGSLP